MEKRSLLYWDCFLVIVSCTNQLNQMAQLDCSFLGRLLQKFGRIFKLTSENWSFKYLYWDFDFTVYVSYLYMEVNLTNVFLKEETELKTKPRSWSIVRLESSSKNFQIIIVFFRLLTLFVSYLFNCWFSRTSFIVNCMKNDS